MYYFKKKGSLNRLKVDNLSELDADNHFLSPINGNIIGVALNSKCLVNHLKSEFQEKPYSSPPKTPVLHIKTENTVIGHKEAIKVPNAEVFSGPALGIVIGKRTRRIEKQEAYDSILGFTVVNEVSLAETSFYRPAVAAKCRDTFCPIGPWIIDKSSIENINNLPIKTYINDKLVHETNTNQLVHDIEEIITYISSFITLEEGDLIIAGTPLRVPELRIKPNDTVSISIDGIGRLTNPVEPE